GEKTSVPPLFSLDESTLVPPEVFEIPPPVASRAPWVITVFMLMRLNSYFPQLSPVSSFWSPLREAIPVLHWAESWWFLSPGWEPNLVSLAPLSYTISVSSIDGQAGATGLEWLGRSTQEQIFHQLYESDPPNVLRVWWEFGGFLGTAQDF
ncbi:hypothetical protein DSO57_1015526, partial [Entomophthora muscae]